MIRNEYLIKLFLNNEKEQNCNMRSTGTKLFSWQTCIAQKSSKGIIVNVNKYSKSTSAQQSKLMYLIKEGKHNYVETRSDVHIKRGTTNLEKYI